MIGRHLTNIRIIPFTRTGQVPIFFLVFFCFCFCKQRIPPPCNFNANMSFIKSMTSPFIGCIQPLNDGPNKGTRVGGTGISIRLVPLRPTCLLQTKAPSLWNLSSCQIVDHLGKDFSSCVPHEFLIYKHTRINYMSQPTIPRLGPLYTWLKPCVSTSPILKH